MKYKIFSANLISGIESEINNALADGWQLNGGIGIVPIAAGQLGANIGSKLENFVSGLLYDLLYCQAMSRE